jgi:hypothetical protein
MEVFVIENQSVGVAFILKKITNTVQAYTERYPELMYITSGIKLVKTQTGPDEDLDLLEGLNQYMKEKLFEYHVIKIMQHKFQHDIHLLKNGLEINEEQELYLDFA